MRRSRRSTRARTRSSGSGSRAKWARSRARRFWPVSRREAPPDAFGRTAREYELGRPGWPEELLDQVVAELGLGANAEVLDLGAGTGKLTRALVPRFARVVAVEPDDAMRAVLEEVVPRADALAGRGEAIPLAERSVDAVFSAEAFHWFATEDSVAEIA